MKWPQIGHVEQRALIAGIDGLLRARTVKAIAIASDRTDNGQRGLTGVFKNDR